MIIDETDGEVNVSFNAIVEKTAVIIGPAVVEEEAYVGHYAVIGGAAQHSDYWPYADAHRPAGVIIRKGGVVREHCQVQQGVKRRTIVGMGAHIMAQCHISHDTIIGVDATLSTNSIMGGHTIICEGATLGQCVVTHPWTVIGGYAMIGQGACVVKNIPPTAKAAGVPAVIIGENTGPGGPKRNYDLERVAETYREQYASAIDENEELRSEP